jgi:hypothetical protein
LLKQFAPQYCEAASAQKGALLDTFVQATGYHRRYGMWLLNHAEDVLQAPAYKRASHYGPDVQHALFLVWHAANRICAKRLIPFLPTLVEALERHEHLHLTEECRRQLLSMSAATADRLLRSQRKVGTQRPLHHASGNAAQAADPDPHLRGVEGDPTRLSGSRSRGSLWR